MDRRRFIAACTAVPTGLTFAALSGCGFRLRSALELPFARLHLAMPPQSELYALIKRQVESSTSTRIVADPQQADAILHVLGDEQGREILSLSAAGRVREFELARRFSYRLTDAQGRELQPPTRIVLRREITFDDARVLSKENEEALLQRDMQLDLVQQLLRRLASGARRSSATP